MVSLRELSSLGQAKSSFGVGIEVESATLAEIYEKQRYFKKSLSIYKRLLDKSPQNEFLQGKVRQLSDRVESEDDAAHEEFDSATADTLVTVDDFDRRIRFLQELLGELGSG